MINTILKGFFSIVITMTNIFLQPIYNLIANIDIGGMTIADVLNQVNGYIVILRGGLSWVANATGLPSWLFGVMGLFLTANISVRVSIYVIKLILKWYRKLMP